MQRVTYYLKCALPVAFIITSFYVVFYFSLPLKTLLILIKIRIVTIPPMIIGNKVKPPLKINMYINHLSMKLCLL